MRKLLPLLCLVVFLAVAMPAQAQLRQNLPVQRASSKLFDSEAVSFVMNKIFSPQHFRMQHSYEMSFGSFGGHSSSLGMYTNTMMWQFDQKLAARVDIAFAHSPFGNSFGLQQGIDGQGGRVFLRNAEIAYRPNERVNLHFSIRQSPYGAYMSPYGYFNPYYMGGYGFRDFHSADDLFWKDNPR